MGFLKRFANLENLPKDIFVKKGLRISKRFECLEIGDKKITFTLTDKISPIEKAAENTNHKIICPYCGEDNNKNDENCTFCKRIITTKFTEEFQDYASSIIRCECGTVNRKEKKYCWVCGRLLSENPSNPAIQQQNTIVVNIDGKEYRSDDRYLPPKVVELMNRIRKEGYKKEIIDEWIRENNSDRAETILQRNTRLINIRWRIVCGILVLIAAIVIILISIFIRYIPFSGL